MTKAEAIAMIDAHKNKLVNPVEMLHWTWLRVIIAYIAEEDWDTALDQAEKVLRGR